MRRGFTLIELMVVMFIILIVSAVVLPTIVSSYADLGVKNGAGTVKGALDQSREQALNATTDGVAGVRFIPNTKPTFLDTDGDDIPDTLDPNQALAYSHIVTLRRPPDYTEGMVSYNNAGYSMDVLNALFSSGISPYRRLIIEQALGDGVSAIPGHLEGLTNTPTSWYWNIRVGDVLIIREHRFIVCGPMAMTPAGGQNPEGYVNIGKPGQSTSPIMRPYFNDVGPVEFLYLVNTTDDDGDGAMNSGWDGIDNDLDSPAGASANGRPDVPGAGWTTGVDEDDEWEDEQWPKIFAAGFTSQPYRIVRRPMPRKQETVEIHNGAMVDATGWANTPTYHQEASWTDRSGTPRTSPGWDYSMIRSRLPVNPFTGEVDLVVDEHGGWTTSSFYGSVSQIGYGHDLFQFWIANNADVLPVPLPKGSAALVSVHQKTGRIVVNDAFPDDVEGTFMITEGR